MRALRLLTNLFNDIFRELTNWAETLDRDLAGEPIEIYTRRRCSFGGRPSWTAWQATDYRSGYPTRSRYYEGVHNIAEGVDMVIGRLAGAPFKGVQFKVVGLRSRRVITLGKGNFPNGG